VCACATTHIHRHHPTFIHTHTHPFTPIHTHTHPYTILHPDRQQLRLQLGVQLSYIYIYISVHVYTCTYMYIHIHAYVCISGIHIYEYVYTYICVHAHLHIDVYVYTYVCMYIYMYTYIYAYCCSRFLRTHSLTHTHTHKHTLSHSHTHAQSTCSCSCCPCSRCSLSRILPFWPTSLLLPLRAARIGIWEDCDNDTLLAPLAAAADPVAWYEGMRVALMVPGRLRVIKGVNPSLDGASACSCETPWQHTHMEQASTQTESTRIHAAWDSVERQQRHTHKLCRYTYNCLAHLAAAGHSHCESSLHANGFCPAKTPSSSQAAG